MIKNVLKEKGQKCGLGSVLVMERCRAGKEFFSQSRNSLQFLLYHLKKKMVDNYSPVEKILGFIVVVVGTIYEKHIL